LDESLSSRSGIAEETLRERDRRLHPRARCELFDFTDFGPVILLDLSEGGLGFQGVAAVVEGQVVHLKFTLPGTSAHIEADGQVTRSDNSTKRAGLRFLDLSEDALQQVRTWIWQETNVTELSSTAQTEVDWDSASAAIDKPKSSAADSATTEQASILAAPEIAEGAEPKPDEAPPVVSHAPRRAGDELVEPAAPPKQVAADEDIDRVSIVDQTSIDQFTPIKTSPPDEVSIAMALSAAHSSPDASTEALETSLSAEPHESLPPPERKVAERVSLFAADAPAAGRHGKDLYDAKQKLPTREQIERRAYEIYLKRGHQNGNETADWIAAERELTSHDHCEAAEPSSLDHQQDNKATRMLLDFYGLREQPFGMTPDPAYLYGSRTHVGALAALSFGIQDSRGFLALIAEPGMGKTTLLYQLLEELRDSARTVFVFQTQCDSRELLQYILQDLNINAQGMGLVAMHNKLNEVLFETMFARKRFVLVVDEAQNLKNSVLETVRLLSNFETHHTKLLQIVLAGQPKLAAKLAQPQLSQLRQRIAVLSHLEPLTAAETEHYVDHRLKVAGYCGKPLFEPSAVSLIAQGSRGIPRNINNICYSSLLLAYVRGDGKVTEGTVRRAIEAAGFVRRR
jgi:type II secretory pathway predicted ATPase ExeA